MSLSTIHKGKLFQYKDRQSLVHSVVVVYQLIGKIYRSFRFRAGMNFELARVPNFVGT